MLPLPVQILDLPAAGTAVCFYFTRCKGREIIMEDEIYLVFNDSAIDDLFIQFGSKGDRGQ